MLLFPAQHLLTGMKRKTWHAVTTTNGAHPRHQHQQLAMHGHLKLTRMMRNTLRAVATEACTFFTSPGWPAATNMAAYCGRGCRSKGGAEEGWKALDALIGAG